MSEYIKKEDVENIMLGSWGESALWKIRYLPAADVVEVRHGRWINVKSDINLAECSECGIRVIGKPNYCPDCGAKMDGDKNETDRP